MMCWFNRPRLPVFKRFSGIRTEAEAQPGLSTISIAGGNTGTAQAISVAYNELWKKNLPGALNAMVLETDGLPNTVTMNFWDSTNSVAGVTNASCQDLNGHKLGAGSPAGFGTLTTIVNGASALQWTPQVPLGTSSFLPSSMTYTSGGNVYTPQGIVGAVGSLRPW